jgi:hypothetical protein
MIAQEFRDEGFFFVEVRFAPRPGSSAGDRLDPVLGNWSLLAPNLVDVKSARDDGGVCPGTSE